MICIYSITNTKDGKRYIGKTRDLKSRMHSHKRTMMKYSAKSSSRHLYHACQKYGFESFIFETIETFEDVTEQQLSERELHWMVHFKTTDREYGYNLRMDSSTNCFMHPETRAIQSKRFTGEGNPNYGNKWTDKMKEEMSKDAVARHESGIYGEGWRKKISEASSEMWKCADKKGAMAAKVSVAKMKYDFEQYTREGALVATWSSVKEIIEQNPTYKWQNIYAVCNGYKKTYMNHVWKKKLKDANQ